MWEKIKLLKNKKLLISSLGALSFISFPITLAGVTGYFLARWGGGKKVGLPGRIKSIILNIGRYRLHFHHWLIGLSLFFLGIFAIVPALKETIFQGMIIGVFFQGIFDYPDWYKIIRRAL